MGLMAVKQLPVIIEQLQTVSAEIKQRTERWGNLVVTEENLAEIKKTRAEMRKEYSAMEEQRKKIKQAVLAPYLAFENTYRKCVSVPYEAADGMLKQKIADVENGLLQNVVKELLPYFEELKVAHHVEWLQFEQTGTKVTRSSSLTQLKKQLQTIVKAVGEVEDFLLGEPEDIREEIRLEYRKTLNLAESMRKVKARREAVQSLKEQAAEAEKRRKAEREAVQKVKQTVETLDPPVSVTEREEESQYQVVFTVKGDLEKLQALKRFLDEGGYEYYDE